MLVSVCLLGCNLNVNAKQKNSGYLNPSPKHHQHNWAKNICGGRGGQKSTVTVRSFNFPRSKSQKESKNFGGAFAPLAPPSYTYAKG